MSITLLQLCTGQAIAMSLGPARFLLPWLVLACPALVCPALPYVALPLLCPAPSLPWCALHVMPLHTPLTMRCDALYAILHCAAAALHGASHASLLNVHELQRCSFHAASYSASQAGFASSASAQTETRTLLQLQLGTTASQTSITASSA